MKRRDAINFPPRGLQRFEAAAYIGVGPALFDVMVSDGRMPRPKLANSRKIWDKLALDACFADLPEEGEGGGGGALAALMAS